MVGAAATSVELAVSGTVPLGTVLPAMLGVHALIGVGEAVITVAAVSAVLASRPDLVAVRSRRADARPRAPPAARERDVTMPTRLFVVVALAVAVGLATRRLAVRVLLARTASSGSPPTRPSSTRAGCTRSRRSRRSPTTRSRASRTTRASPTGLGGLRRATLGVFALGVRAGLRVPAPDGERSAHGRALQPLARADGARRRPGQPACTGSTRARRSSGWSR